MKKRDIGRPTTDDPKSKVNFRIRESLQNDIEALSKKLNIPQSSVVDIILSASLPVFENIHKKQIEIEKKNFKK